MTNEDKEALKEFLNGFLGVCAGVSVFFAIVYFSSGGGTPNEKFTVVDKYENCNVVRYAPNNAATYKYFLDCK